jgi:signal peptidase complex subunit 1
MDTLLALVPESIRKISTHMDYEGQRMAERVFQVCIASFFAVSLKLCSFNIVYLQVVLVVSGIIGFFVGYFTQTLSYSVYTVIGGFVLACLITLPPWSYFRSQNLKVCLLCLILNVFCVHMQIDCYYCFHIQNELVLCHFIVVD